MSKDFYFSRKSSRHQNWDYSWKGLYFVTINTRFGEKYFGEVSNGRLQLNEIGKEAERQWLATPLVRPDMNIHLDEYIVMPNHFHGIIGIGRNDFNAFRYELNFNDKLLLSEFEAEDDLPKGRFGPQRKNLGSLMRGFKSSVTSWCRKNNQLFDWHSRYHDIIIRDEISLNKIRNYIRMNPLNWSKDRFYKVKQ